MQKRQVLKICFWKKQKRRKNHWKIYLDRLDNAGLSKEQKTSVDKAISAANDCGAAYGAVAYRLGLQDGIRLASEVKEFE